MEFCKGYTLGTTRLLMDITIIMLKEKFRYIEISARKWHLTAVIIGLKVKLFLNKSFGFFFPLRISITTSLLNIWWLYNKMKHNKSILDLHFSYPTKINTNEFFFLIFLENNIMQMTLKVYIIYHKYESKWVPHKRELIDLYVFQKSQYSVLLFWRYNKICNSTPNPSWMIYAPHFSSLQAVSKMHCIYANAVVQPSVQHCPCYMVWKTKVRTWCRHYPLSLCINAPMWREKRWLQGLFDPPSW